MDEKEYHCISHVFLVFIFRFGSTNDYVRYRMEARRVKRFQIGDSISPSSFVPVKRKSRTYNYKVSLHPSPLLIFQLIHKTDIQN